MIMALAADWTCQRVLTTVPTPWERKALTSPTYSSRMVCLPVIPVSQAERQTNWQPFERNFYQFFNSQSIVFREAEGRLLGGIEVITRVAGEVEDLAALG